MGRRTNASIHAQRERDWAWFKTHAYASYRSCQRCGQVRFCAGRRYDTQKCKACHMQGQARTTRRDAA